MSKQLLEVSLTFTLPDFPNHRPVSIASLTAASTAFGNSFAQLKHEVQVAKKAIRIPGDRFTNVMEVGKSLDHHQQPLTVNILGLSPKRCSSCRSSTRPSQRHR